MKIIERMPPNKPGSRWGYRPCQGEVSAVTREWAERCGKTPSCSFRAAYIVNGKELCDRHAGKELIAMMLLQERPMNDADFEFLEKVNRIQCTEFRSDDIVILSTVEYINQEMTQRLKEALKSRLPPGTATMILSGGMKIEILRKQGREMMDGDL